MGNNPIIFQAINEKRKLYDQSDVDELMTELRQIQGNLNEEIINKHNAIRTPHGDEIINSKIQIVNVLNLYCSIIVQNFD